MSSAQKQYCKEMKNKFGYYAAWTPGTPFKLGDIGTVSGSVFTRLGNVGDHGITFEIREDHTPSSIDHSSSGSVTVKTKLEGQVAPSGSVLTDLDAGIIVEFSRENSVLFKAQSTVSPSIKDQIKLGNEILALYNSKNWKKEWMVITELIEADSATIIISKSSNSKIELKANANVSAANINIGDAGFHFSIESSKDINTNVIAQEHLTPLFKLRGISDTIFTQPTFRSQLTRSSETGTASLKVEDQNLYFSEIENKEEEE